MELDKVTSLYEKEKIYAEAIPRCIEKLPDESIQRFFTVGIARALKRVGECGHDWNTWAKHWLTGADTKKNSAENAVSAATSHCRKAPNARYISARWATLAVVYYCDKDYVKAQDALIQAAAFGEWTNGHAMFDEYDKQYKSISSLTKEV